MRDKKCFSEALAEAQRPAKAKAEEKMHFLSSKPFLSQVVLISSGADTFSIALKASPTKAI